MESTLRLGRVTTQSGCGMQKVAMQSVAHSEGTLIRFGLLQSHLMEGTLCLVQRTTQFVSGMLPVARHWAHHSEGTLARFTLLQSRRQESGSCLDRLTEQSGFGILNPCTRTTTSQQPKYVSRPT